MLFLFFGVGFFFVYTLHKLEVFVRLFMRCICLCLIQFLFGYIKFIPFMDTVSERTADISNSTELFICYFRDNGLVRYNVLQNRCDFDEKPVILFDN